MAAAMQRFAARTLCSGIMSLDELEQRLVTARGRNKQEICRLFSIN